MKMKNYLPLFLFVFIFINTSAQDVSGLYSGVLVNDSTKKVQNYELALSEYKGKITGYAYTTFVVNDTFYYSVKRIKATKANGELIVEDVKMLVNNFPSTPSKGVHQINTIPLDQQDTINELKGTWRTTKTKVYYSIHGQLELKKDNDSLRSPLIQHLYELNVLSKPSVTQVNNTVKQKTKPASIKSSVVAPQEISVDKRTPKVLRTIDIHSDSLILSFYDNGVVDGDTISVEFNGQRIIAQVKLTAVAVKKTIWLKPGETDTYQLTLIAENLGTIPPNTGLLIVQDGKNKFEIHFTADLQNNAVVEFRKK
jgi:hypothetical protein